MRAVTLLHGDLDLSELPTPEPGPGQLLVEVSRCGICGSDLHARRQGDELAEVLELVGYPRYLRSDQRVVLGHEIYGVVADRGSGTRAPGTRGALADGTPVVSVPLVRRDGQVDGIGLSASAPGGFADQVVVQESLTLPVPNGLAPDLAALTEPVAVAWHAVVRGEVGRKDVAVVIGCGPVGLAVIAVLKARGVRSIVASDPAPGRRALALRCGATLVVDPTEDSPYAAADAGHITTMTAATGAGIDAIEGFRKLPLPWWYTWRVLDRLGLTKPKAPVVFECVGVPGMIDGILAGAPLSSRVVVVGVCMGADRIRPAVAVNKEMDLRFVVGYSPLEFRDALHALAEGKVDASAIVTGRVGLAGVAPAFTALSDPGTHAKILIDPAVTADTVLP